MFILGYQGELKSTRWHCPWGADGCCSIPIITAADAAQIESRRLSSVGKLLIRLQICQPASATWYVNLVHVTYGTPLDGVK